MGDKRRLRCAVAAVAAGVVAGAVVAWLVLRALREPEQTRQVRRPRTEPRLRPTTMPTTHPSVDRWLNDGTYVTSDGRTIETSDIDSDGLYDANEIRAYGTLRYDGHTRVSGNVPRIDSPPPAVLFAHDTDRDGLPDEWERGYFGTLDQGRLDDPDGDGYPNYMERNLRQSPIAIDLAHPGARPKKFPKLPSGIRRPAWSMGSSEFWAAQDRAREWLRKGEPATRPAVAGFVWKGRPAAPPPKPKCPERVAREQLCFALRESAKAPLLAAADVDRDLLADEWERQTLGSLDYDRYDDPDGDGFPNVIEWYRGTDPLAIDLLHPLHKPAKLEPMPEATSPWSLCWDVHMEDFWRIQERARARLAARAADRENGQTGAQAR